MTPFWLGTLPAHNVTLCDTAGSLVAVCAFACLLYAPGYALAYAGNLFGFRRQGFAERSLAALACSFMVMPVAAYMTGKIAGIAGVGWLALACGAATLWLVWKRRPTSAWARHDKLAAAALATGWILFVLLMLVDFERGHKLYFSVVMADQSYRIAFTDAVARTGVPPANPLYFGGTPAAMHYYYFWYVLCATVMKLAHVTARQAFIASSIWAGFGLMATLRLFTTHFFAWERKWRWAAMGMLAVMGADLLPSVGNAILQPALNGDIEWWSVDPIDAWPDSLLWVPHHVASALCCLLAFLFVWRTREAIEAKQRLWAIGLAAIAVASAFGLSVYVTCGFGMMMAAWLLWICVRRRDGRTRLLQAASIVALTSAVLIVPFALELVRTLPTAATAGLGSVAAPHTFVLSVRRMIDSDLLTGLPQLAAWKAAHPVMLDQIIRLLLLLPGLAMELGVYGAVLYMLLRSRKRLQTQPDFARDTALFLTLSGLAIAMFVSSSAISNNDFGYRAVMLPQFFLLLLSVDVFRAWDRKKAAALVSPTPWRRRIVRLLLALGVAGTVYGAVLLRVWLPMEERKPGSGFADSPTDAFEVREVFQAFRASVPRDAVIAFQPNDPTVDRGNAVMTGFEYFQRSLVMDAGRQILNAEGKCATHFGGDAAPCSAIQEATQALYASPAPSAEWAQEFCSRFGVQYLLVGHRDTVWNDHAGWPASLPMVAAQPHLAILRCAR